MNVSKAREYFGLGIVNGFSAMRCRTGWRLIIAGQGGPWLLETARLEKRVFKTLDAVAATVQEIAGPEYSFDVSTVATKAIKKLIAALDKMDNLEKEAEELGIPFLTV